MKVIVHIAKIHGIIDVIGAKMDIIFPQENAKNVMIYYVLHAIKKHNV